LKIISLILLILAAHVPVSRILLLFRLGYNVPISLQLVENNHSIILIIAAHVPVSKLSLLFV
jgi:hypothetical protein